MDDLDLRWSTQTLRVAVLGAVKREKTSIVNALLGQDFLPIGKLPVHEFATEIRHGEELACYIGSEVLANRQRLLAEYACHWLKIYLEQACLLADLESQFVDRPTNQEKIIALISELKELSAQLRVNEK